MAAAKPPRKGEEHERICRTIQGGQKGRRFDPAGCGRPDADPTADGPGLGEWAHDSAALRPEAGAGEAGKQGAISPPLFFTPFPDTAPDTS